MTKRYSVEFEIHDHCIHDEIVREEVLKALDNIKQYEIEGICISRKKIVNPWHTGTPTEDDWYLCKSEHMIGYDVGYYANGRFNRLHYFNQEDITEWQKIEL